MRPTVLDNSVLCLFWQQKCAKAGRPPDERTAAQWAEELVRLHRTDAIVTPVRIEFVCGARSAEELAAFRVFIERLRVIDEGRILPTDWQEARRLAERVPRDGRRRQLGDCLIRAIAERLNHDVKTFDTGFPS